MGSICLFASYFPGQEIPYYITVYLKELNRHFDEVVFLCSTDIAANDRAFLSREKIRMIREENKGFDFGLWYQAFQTIDLTAYERVALVNDSCILFRPLDEFMNWARQEKADIQGMTASQAVYPHLQSYFLLLNKKAVELTKGYFTENKVLSDISQVIQTYEIGLNKFWQQKGLSISAFIDNNGYTGEFSPYYQCVDYHLDKGIPLIKKKIIFSSYRKPELFTLARMNFNTDPRYYLEKIRPKTDLIIDVERLQLENRQMGAWDHFKYNMTRRLIRIFRPAYKFIKRA